ncbi:MAG: hypothetical protein KGL00_07225, partial [Gammaproteobacteria bacterium]|nr:hypothetical protein [Gammaproteobacteria bacterium]
RNSCIAHIAAGASATPLQQVPAEGQSPAPRGLSHVRTRSARSIDSIGYSSPPLWRVALCFNMRPVLGGEGTEKAVVIRSVQ